MLFLIFIEIKLLRSFYKKTFRANIQHFSMSRFSFKDTGDSQDGGREETIFYSSIRLSPSQKPLDFFSQLCM